MSEFLTTCCCAHLSFLDSGKTRSSKGWDEDDDVEDDYFRGAVHDLNFNDGKRENCLDRESLFEEELLKG